MQHTRNDLEDTELLGLRQVDRPHRLHHLREVLRIVDALHAETLTLAQVVETGRVLNAQPPQECLVPMRAQLVEDVKIALLADLADHARLLQQEVSDAAAVGLTRPRELNLHVLAESA